MSGSSTPVGGSPVGGSPVGGSPLNATTLRALEAVLPPIVALCIAAVIGDLLILSFGESPAAGYALLIKGTWGNSYRI